MNRRDESIVREILRKHLEKATDEIAAAGDDIATPHWTEGNAERLAEICMHAIALMQEVTAEVTSDLKPTR